MFDRKSFAALCALAGLSAGCSATSRGDSQVITGRIDPRGATAVRAIAGTEVVTAGKLAANGAFALGLPPGATYRLEIMTATGVVPVVNYSGGAWKPLEVRVCAAGAPFDVGGIVTASTTMPCSPMDPDASCPEPHDDCLDPNSGEMCDPPGPEPECNPMDPSSCPPPDGGCNPMDPSSCPPPDEDCDTKYPSTCPPPTPCNLMLGECDDDPCVTDPSTCGCDAMTDACWPAPDPDPCQGQMCDPDHAMTPQHVPTALGCEG